MISDFQYTITVAKETHNDLTIKSTFNFKGRESVTIIFLKVFDWTNIFSQSIQQIIHTCQCQYWQFFCHWRLTCLLEMWLCVGIFLKSVTAPPLDNLSSAASFELALFEQVRSEPYWRHTAHSRHCYNGDKNKDVRCGQHDTGLVH